MRFLSKAIHSFFYRYRDSESEHPLSGAYRVACVIDEYGNEEHDNFVYGSMDSALKRLDELGKHFESTTVPVKLYIERYHITLSYWYPLTNYVTIHPKNKVEKIEFLTSEEMTI